MSEGVALIRDVAAAIRGGGVILHPAHQQAMEANATRVDDLLIRACAESTQVTADLANEGIARVAYDELVRLNPEQLAGIVIAMRAALEGAFYRPATGWHPARLAAERILHNVVRREVGAGS